MVGLQRKVMCDEEDMKLDETALLKDLTPVVDIGADWSLIMTVNRA